MSGVVRVPVGRGMALEMESDFLQTEAGAMHLARTLGLVLRVWGELPPPLIAAESDDEGEG